MRELFRSIETRHVLFAGIVLLILNNLVWYDKLRNVMEGCR